MGTPERPAVIGRPLSPYQCRGCLTLLYLGACETCGPTADRVRPDVDTAFRIAGELGAAWARGECPWEAARDALTAAYAVLDDAGAA